MWEANLTMMNEEGEKQKKKKTKKKKNEGEVGEEEAIHRREIMRKVLAIISAI